MLDGAKTLADLKVQTDTFQFLFLRFKDEAYLVG